jgi:hypothetical protein
MAICFLMRWTGVQDQTTDEDVRDRLSIFVIDIGEPNLILRPISAAFSDGREGSLLATQDALQETELAFRCSASTSRAGTLLVGDDWKGDSEKLTTKLLWNSNCLGTQEADLKTQNERR